MTDEYETLRYNKNKCELLVIVVGDRRFHVIFPKDMDEIHMVLFKRAIENLPTPPITLKEFFKEIDAEDDKRKKLQLSGISG